MLENSNAIVSGIWSDNSVVTNHINLWEEIDSFISISTNDSKLLDLLSKKIYDVLISKIIGVDTYTELSECLDIINTNLQSYVETGYNLDGLSMIIWIQEQNILYFSKMWKASALLIKPNSEVIEITDVKEEPVNFVYISNGDIKSGEIVLFSSNRILNHLTNTELLESSALWTIEDQNKNIQEIISEENIGKDISIISFKYSHTVGDEEENIISKATNVASVSAEKLWDTLIVKRIIAIVFKLRDSFRIPKNISKNTILFVGIFAAFILLYSVSSSLFKTTDTIIVEDYKDNLAEARQYITHASENIANPDIFTADLKKSEDLIDGIKDKQLFLSDIEKLLTDINALRKQFNQVDTYDFSEDKLLLAWPFDSVKMVGLAWKVYSVGKNKIVWPIVTWVEPTNYEFEFSEEDSFVDAIELNNRIVLLTKNNRIVAFNAGGTFSYLSANGQEKWQDIDKIGKFRTNLYTLDGSWESSQIYKHESFNTNFNTWTSYLTDADSKDIGRTLAMAIDGGFYVLKEDLTMIKFFSNPYRIESLFLNGLPANYEYDEKSPVFLITRPDLSYIYLYMNKKIWIFEPNTTNYINTKSLQYIGQIEWGTEDISSFYVKSDGNIHVGSASWIYKLEFQVSDNKLIVQ